MHRNSEIKKVITPFLIVIIGCVVAYSANIRLSKSAFTSANHFFMDTIKIINANTLSLQKENDSTNLTILEGNVILQQGSTIFKSDKAIKNDRQNTFEAWGHVHINDNDTTNIYSDHLRYLGTPQIAYLDGNVKLTDGQATLLTPSLVYNMNTNMGTYNEGGKVLNKKSVITSKEGVYYSDIKDVYFKKNVVVTDPAYHITTDSLLYNTRTQIATFITQTHIKDSSRRSMNTKEGFYDLRTGIAQFKQRSSVYDEDRKTTVTGDNLDLTDSIAKATGNAIVTDSVRGTIIIGNLIFQNRINDAILATQKPLMIIKQDKDSIYVAADTLFSAKLTDLLETRSSHIIDTSSLIQLPDSAAIGIINKDTVIKKEKVVANVKKNNEDKDSTNR